MITSANTREFREIGIGAVVVLALVLVLATLQSGSASLDQGGGDQFIGADFGKVDGLSVGDGVFLAGIRVGSVVALGLSDNFRAVATMKIDPGVLIPTDSAVAIHTDGLFGAKFMVIIVGSEEEFLTSGDLIINTQSAVVVGDLLDLIISEGHAARAKK